MSANRQKTDRKAPKTAFKKGQSGNPSGRPKLKPEEKDALQAIRDLAPNAAEVVAELLNNKQVSPAVRLNAANMVLERAYGKPDAKITIEQPDYSALDKAFESWKEQNRPGS